MRTALRILATAIALHAVVRSLAPAFAGAQDDNCLNNFAHKTPQSINQQFPWQTTRS
jgi:hypothetical protein